MTIHKVPGYETLYEYCDETDRVRRRPQKRLIGTSYRTYPGGWIKPFRRKDGVLVYSFNKDCQTRQMRVDALPAMIKEGLTYEQYMKERKLSRKKERERSRALSE